MAIYSISDLEKLSGVKAHTIRMWEKRYDLLNPKRTASNIRYYDDADLQRLLNVCILNREGHRISQIAKMSPDEIQQETASIKGTAPSSSSSQVDVMTLAIIRMDEYMIDKIIQTHIDQTGFEHTMLNLIYPMLDKIGLLWITGSMRSYQEHYINFMIRQKLITAIDQLPISTKKNQPRFLLFLPELESQELNLLFVHYLLKSRGFKVIYLGNNNRLPEIQEAASMTQATHIFTIITESFHEEPVQTYVDNLRKHFPDKTILLTGYQVIAQGVGSDEQVKVLDGLQEMLSYLKTLSVVPTE